MLESSGTWLESPSRAGKTSGNTRHCAGSTKSSRTRAGSSRASPGATPAATYARSRTGKRASHHFCGVSRSGWASSGACQGKPVRRCRRRSSLLASSPGAACFRQWSMEPLHRPRRWWASVPSKSQIRHFTMPPSQGVEVREQDRLQMHGSGRAARRVPPELHGLEPLGVVEREEPELRQDVCGAEQPRVAYRRQLTRLPGDLHVVGGERLAAVLEGEAARLQPHCSLATGQRLLAVEPPVEEPDVPQRVEDHGRARGEEGAPEVLLTVAQQRGVEAQDVLRAAATVLPAHVGPVPLGVVVLPPRVVRFRKFGEGFGLFEVPVGHPLLDAEGRFYVGLVRLAPLYLLLPYPEGPVDGPGLLGLEDPAPVGDEPLRWAVALDDGLITKQKFCFTRCGSLVLPPPRSQASPPPNRHRNLDSSQAYPPREAAQRGGPYETPVQSPQTDNTAPGRQRTLGPSLPEHPAMDSGERTRSRSGRQR